MMIPVIDFPGLPVIVLVMAVAQVVMPVFFQRGGGFQFAPEDSHDPPIVPAGYTFFIWGLIYLLCLAYGVYQVLPGQSNNPVLVNVRFYSAVAFLGAALWIFTANKKRAWLSLLVIFIMWLALGSAFIGLQNGMFSTLPYIFIFVTLSIYFGWVTIAMFANLAAALKVKHVMKDGLSEVNWSSVILAIAGAGASAIVYFSHGNLWYFLTVVWALIGIIMANYNNLISRRVGIVAVVMGLVIALAFMLSPA